MAGWNDPRDVEYHEVKRESPCSHTNKLSPGCEVVYHATHDHVCKSVCQKRRNLQSVAHADRGRGRMQDLPSQINS